MLPIRGSLIFQFLLLMLGAAFGADYYPLYVGLTWITKTVNHGLDGSIDSVYDTTWISGKGQDSEGHEIFRFKNRSSGVNFDDSSYAYKIGNVVYRRHMSISGKHYLSDEYRTNLQDNMAYVASEVDVDTKDTVLKLPITVRYVGHIQTPYSPFDSCFELTATFPGTEDRSVLSFGPNVGNIKTVVNQEGVYETELLYFGNGLPTSIAFRNSWRAKSGSGNGERISSSRSEGRAKNGTYDLMGRAWSQQNGTSNRILIGKL